MRERVEFHQTVYFRPSPSRTPSARGGSPHILSWVTEVATRALKAVWYQKWFVHRVGIPVEQQATYHDGFSLTLTKFDGTTVTI
jgi:hypothetical protein